MISDRRGFIGALLALPLVGKVAALDPKEAAFDAVTPYMKGAWRVTTLGQPIYFSPKPLRITDDQSAFSSIRVMSQEEVEIKFPDYP